MHRAMTRRRVRTAAAIGYAALAVLFVILWETEPALLEGETSLDPLFGAALLLVHPIAGFLIPRLWAFALPFVALLVSLPFSEPDPELMGVTDSGAMLIGGVAAMILMAFGMSCRLTLDAFREPR
jgi:hypothetical protein